MKTAPYRQSEHGMVLLEALIAILIFSFGILGLINLQATAINASTDAKDRADAAILANYLIGRLAISDPASVASYAHHKGGTVCAPNGGASTAPVVTEWLTQVADTLPGASADKQQVIVDASNNVVTVGICWQPHDGKGSMHKLVVTTQMQWP